MIVKQSLPFKSGDVWRILRHDGVIVGAYATKLLAQRVINQSAWLL